MLNQSFEMGLTLELQPKIGIQSNIFGIHARRFFMKYRWNKKSPTNIQKQNGKLKMLRSFISLASQWIMTNGFAVQRTA